MAAQFDRRTDRCLHAAARPVPHRLAGQRREPDRADGTRPRQRERRDQPGHGAALPAVHRGVRRGHQRGGEDGRRTFGQRHLELPQHAQAGTRALHRGRRRAGRGHRAGRWRTGSAASLADFARPRACCLAASCRRHGQHRGQRASRQPEHRRDQRCAGRRRAGRVLRHRRAERRQDRRGRERCERHCQLQLPGRQRRRQGRAAGSHRRHGVQCGGTHLDGGALSAEPGLLGSLPRPVAAVDGVDRWRSAVRPAGLDQAPEAAAAESEPGPRATSGGDQAERCLRRGHESPGALCAERRQPAGQLQPRPATAKPGRSQDLDRDGGAGGPHGHLQPGRRAEDLPVMTRSATSVAPSCDPVRR
ncbi:hypothetical protein VARIO8X_130144 [Burkholderiales bacterium 8X]|nr:hypothetical protein VARIO8X_130144 [Burkholderiales bacterium 8X]